MNHRLVISLLGLMLGMVLLACSAQGGPQQPETKATANTSLKTHALSIVGYNYTDRYIDSFTVNGQGGGNLDISTPTAGGGSSMCCVNWRDGSTLPKKVTVLWVAAYCMQRRTNSDGETKDWREPLWKKTDVYFNGPVPANPRNFEVHFYRDDRIEVAMTAGYSPPRLKLPAPPNGYIRPGLVVNDPPCDKDYDRAFSSDKAIKVNATEAIKP